MYMNKNSVDDFKRGISRFVFCSLEIMCDIIRERKMWGIIQFLLYFFWDGLHNESIYTDRTVGNDTNKMEKQPQAARYQRNDQRQGYRSGHYSAISPLDLECYTQSSQI